MNEGGDTGRRNFREFNSKNSISRIHHIAFCIRPGALQLFGTMCDTSSVQPPAEAAGREPMPAGSGLYTENCAEIKKSCAGPLPKAMAGIFARRYVRAMARPRKSVASFLALGLGGLSCGLAAGPSLAQDAYGLTKLKPYEAAVTAPPANGLARVIRSQKPQADGAPRPFKPNGGPAFSIHAAGAVMIDSTIRH